MGGVRGEEEGEEWGADRVEGGEVGRGVKVDGGKRKGLRGGECREGG